MEDCYTDEWLRQETLSVCLQYYAIAIAVLVTGSA